MEEKRPQIGDIMQVRRQGRGMVVVNSDSGHLLDMPGISNACLFEWTVDGSKHYGTFADEELVVVGSTQRQSHRETYAWITAAAILTTTTLVEEGKPEMTMGAIRMWSDAVGSVAQNEDRIRLHKLLSRFSLININ